MQIKPDKEWNGFWSLSSVGFILAWLYATVYAVLLLVSALQPNNAGTWDVASCFFLGMFFLPAVIIPIFLIRSFRKKRHLRLGKILPWAFRVIYISIIFALCDCYWMTTQGGTIFSKRASDIGYIGFGYHLNFLVGSGGRHFGPAIWFWFTPFEVDLGHKLPQVCWVWKGVGDD
jgi:hypothetical protein